MMVDFRMQMYGLE